MKVGQTMVSEPPFSTCPPVLVSVYTLYLPSGLSTLCICFVDVVIVNVIGALQGVGVSIAKCIQSRSNALFLGIF